jgi:hypothetical protein
MLGPSLGFVFPGGQYAQSSNGEDTSIRSIAGTGASIGVEAGFRFARRFYLGLVYNHALLGGGNAAAFDQSGNSVDTSANANEYGLKFAYISNPDGIAFYGEIGGAYRTLSASQTVSGTGDSLSETFSGGELSLGVGMHFKVGEWVRLIPKVSVSGGQFGNVSCTVSGGTCSANGSIANEESHTFVLLGITGFVDFARKH